MLPVRALQSHINSAPTQLEPILHARVDAEFPRAMAHFSRLRKHAASAPDVEPYLKKIEAAEQADAERSLAH